MMRAHRILIPIVSQAGIPDLEFGRRLSGALDPDSPPTMQGIATPQYLGRGEEKIRSST
jgi:hypothetical protein